MRERMKAELSMRENSPILIRFPCAVEHAGHFARAPTGQDSNQKNDKTVLPAGNGQQSSPAKSAMSVARNGCRRHFGRIKLPHFLAVRDVAEIGCGWTGTKRRHRQSGASQFFRQRLGE